MPLTMSLELADEGLGILETSMLDAIATLTKDTNRETNDERLDAK